MKAATLGTPGVALDMGFVNVVYTRLSRNAGPSSG